MKRLLIALLLMTISSSAHAVTFIDGPGSYDFREVLEGEVREELLVFDLSDENFVRPLDPLQWSSSAVKADRFQGVVVFGLGDGVNLYGTGAAVDPFAPVGIHLSKVDCDAFGGFHNVCINAKFTSVLNNPFGSSNLIYWEIRWNIVGIFEDGSTAILGGNDHVFSSSVRYTPVPVPLPATLPFMLGCLALLALLRRRRKVTQ